MKPVSILSAGIGLLTLLSCSGNGPMITKSGLKPENFNTIVDGKNVNLYVLKNPSGMEVCATNYGGRIVSIMVPDRNGNFQDVVLGHDSISDYIVIP